MRHVLMTGVVMLTLLSCRQPIGGSCRRDRDCAGSYVCDLNHCTTAEARTVRLDRAADVASGKEAATALAGLLHMDEATRERLEPTAVRDWAVVKTPDARCFVVRRVDAQWKVVGTIGTATDPSMPAGLLPALQGCPR